MEGKTVEEVLTSFIIGRCDTKNVEKEDKDHDQSKLFGPGWKIEGHLL